MLNRMRISILVGVALVGITSLVAIPACSVTPAKVVAEAHTPAQKAFALYGTFRVFEEAGAKLVKTPGTMPQVIQAIQLADAKAKPIADKLYDAAVEVIVIQAQLGAASTPDDRLVIANANLEQWVTNLKPVVNDLIAAVGAK